MALATLAPRWSRHRVLNFKEHSVGKDPQRPWRRCCRRRAGGPARPFVL